MTIMNTSRIYRLVLVATAAVWLSATVARANLGTVTAGTISGTTINGATITGGSITAGGGSEVFMDSDGITIEQGTDDANEIKWDGGQTIVGVSGALFLDAPSGVSIDASLAVDSIQLHTGGDIVLAGSGSTISNPSGSWATGSNQFLCVSGSGTVFPSPTACN
jgi:hypothetical protein